MTTKLHHAVIADATKVREALAEANVKEFNLTIKVSGRTLSDADECKIEYIVGSGWSHEVKGDSVENCLTELLRRLGWHAQHQPTALAAPRTENRAKAIRTEWLAEADISADSDC